MRQAWGKSGREGETNIKEDRCGGVVAECERVACAKATSERHVTKRRASGSVLIGKRHGRTTE